MENLMKNSENFRKQWEDLEKWEEVLENIENFGKK